MDMAVETASQDKADTTTCDLGGQYLTFMLDGEEYGLEIMKVREIMQLVDVTRVPRTPDYVEGVINLRGRVIPVVDLRTKFELGQGKRDELACIIVVDVGIHMGIIVDAVREVFDIPAADIEPVPSMGTSVDVAFILGMGKVDDKVKILLNIAKVLTAGELSAIQEVVAE